MTGTKTCRPICRCDANAAGTCTATAQRLPDRRHHLPRGHEQHDLRHLPLAAPAALQEKSTGGAALSLRLKAGSVQGVANRRVEKDVGWGNLPARSSSAATAVRRAAPPAAAERCLSTGRFRQPAAPSTKRRAELAPLAVFQGVRFRYTVTPPPPATTTSAFASPSTSPIATARAPAPLCRAYSNNVPKRARPSFSSTPKP